MVTPWYGEISDYRFRLINYVGDGFLLGASFGSAFHFIRGVRNSPDCGRLAGGVRAVRTNAPRVAGTCGASLALFWAVESATCLARRRDDHWNSIAAGAATFGLFNARRGAPAATLFALLGAASFAGLAGAWWSIELWHSRLHQLSKEVQMNHGSIADPVIGSIEYKSEIDATLDPFASEQKSELTSKDI